MINSCLNGSSRPTHWAAPGEFSLQYSEKSNRSLLLRAAPTPEHVIKSFPLEKGPNVTAGMDVSMDEVDWR